jgi:hypothetical protein
MHPENFTTPLGPKSQILITQDQVFNTNNRIVSSSLESDQLMSFLRISGKNKDFNIHRVYRLLVKRVDYTHIIPTVNYVDAVIPEHHNKSGLLWTPDESTGEDHVCRQNLCIDSVRLIPVGREDLLDKLCTWWYTCCADVDEDLTTIVIEQDSYTAQKQIEAAGFTPKVIFDYLQFCVTDCLIAAYDLPGSDGDELLSSV